jgi:hypothetical protein
MAGTWLGNWSDRSLFIKTIRYGTQSATIRASPTFCGAWGSRSEFDEILDRAQAANVYKVAIAYTCHVSAGGRW